MDKLINFLKDKITDKISFEEIVNVFEQMCNIPLEEDMIFLRQEHIQLLQMSQCFKFP